MFQSNLSFSISFQRSGPCFPPGDWEVGLEQSGNMMLRKSKCIDDWGSNVPVHPLDIGMGNGGHPCAGSTTVAILPEDWHAGLQNACIRDPTLWTSHYLPLYGHPRDDLKSVCQDRYKCQMRCDERRGRVFPDNTESFLWCAWRHLSKRKATNFRMGYVLINVWPQICESLKLLSSKLGKSRPIVCDLLNDLTKKELVFVPVMQLLLYSIYSFGKSYCEFAYTSTSNLSGADPEFS